MVLHVVMNYGIMVTDCRAEDSREHHIHRGSCGDSRWEGAADTGGKGVLPREVVPPSWEDGVQ